MSKRTLRIGKIPYRIEKFYGLWEDINEQLPQFFSDPDARDFRKFRKSLYRHLKALRACTPLTMVVQPLDTDAVYVKHPCYFN